MLIVTAQNITLGGLTRDGGESDYDVWVGINSIPIWKGSIKGHVRQEGAAKLLRLIADKMEKT